MFRSETTAFRFSTSRTAHVCIFGTACAALFVWAFWYTFVDLWNVWRNNVDYSAGQLVPLAALYMVWTRRKGVEDLTPAPRLLGLAIFSAGLATNLAGNYFLFSSLASIGMVTCANGLVIALVGWQVYKRLWYPLVYLFLMMPLPGRIHDAIALPLQGVAAQISAAFLELIGLPTERFGHVLEIAGYRIAVAEACNGLRMASAFVIVAGVVAYVVPGRRWQKVFLLLSSVPIALACNTLRVVATGCLYAAGREELAQGIFHDGMGLIMMPAALLLLLVEARLLAKFTVSWGAAYAPRDKLGSMAASAKT